MNTFFQFISNNYVVHCRFGTKSDNKPEYTTEYNPGCAEIFFARTDNLISLYYILERFIDKNDKLKADKFKSEEDRYTYLFCHTLLRMVLSKKLNISPEYLLIAYDNNNKPHLSGNPLYFNISHTRDSFAIIISEQFRVGIDLEKVDRLIDFASMLKKSFSKHEREFILEFPDDSRNRFFVLWTRKEALLKAIGSGITVNLSGIEVLNIINIIDSGLFIDIADDSVLCDYYIYSRRILEWWISFAVPQKTEIVIHKTDDQDTDSSDYLMSFLKSYN